MKMIEERQMVWGNSFNFLRFSLLCKIRDNDHRSLLTSAVPHRLPGIAPCKKDAGKLSVRAWWVARAL